MNQNEKITRPVAADFAGKSQEEIHVDHHLHSYLSQEYFEAEKLNIAPVTISANCLERECLAQ